MKRVNLQFDENEFIRLSTVAKDRKMKVGTYCRITILNEIDSSIGPNVDTETINMFIKSKMKRGKK